MTVAKFFESSSESELLEARSIMHAIKGKRTLNNYKCLDVLKMPFYKVLAIRTYHNENNIPYLCSTAIGIGESELGNCQIEDLLYFLRFIEEELEKIEMLEQKLREDDSEEAMKLELAGIGEMGIFEELNIIDELAGGDILKWKQIERMPYQEIYTKLLRNKIKNNVNRRYHRNEHSSNK